jgi:hypothetical protein
MGAIYSESYESRKNSRANGSAISVTGPVDPYCCETSRLSHFVYSRHTDGGEIVSLTLRPPFTPKKIAGTDLLETESIPGI